MSNSPNVLAVALMKKRIVSCKSKPDFEKQEKSMMRLYDVGTFTEKEFARLDAFMVDHMIKLDII